MKNYLITVSLAIIFVACNNKKQGGNVVSQTSQSVENMADAPKFRFEESSYNFGKITTGEKVTHEFKFTNVGKIPLIISDAQATCGCTVPDFPDEPIAPGEEGVIKVIFNSAGKSGKQDKVITLTANTNPAKTQLHLIGEIEAKDTETGKNAVKIKE